MKKQRLSDAYRFKGFVPEHEVRAITTDTGGRVVRLKRRQKKRFVRYAAKASGHITTALPGIFATYPAAICESILKSRCDESIVGGATW